MMNTRRSGRRSSGWYVIAVWASLSAAARAAPQAGEPPPGSPACDLRGVDWKNFKFPKSPRIGDAFTLESGHAELAVETGLPDADPDTGYSLSLEKVEYLASGRDAEAFVSVHAAWNGPGNAGTDAVAVFVFKAGRDCRPRHLGTIDTEAVGGLAGDAYVVDDGHRRSEWRVVNGKLGKPKVSKK